MKIINWLKKKLGYRNNNPKMHRDNAQVLIGDQEVKLILPDDREFKVAWNELSLVAIETNNQGPFVEDVFWVLATKEYSLRIPQSATGSTELLERLQSLPNFDNGSVISAMGCAEDRFFICWDSEKIEA
jgi:hypothetical protein